MSHRSFLAWQSCFEQRMKCRLVHQARTAIAATLAVGLISSPLLASGRLSLWDDCLMEGSTPSIQASLSQMNYPDREAIAEVAEFLRNEGVKDGEVSCLNGHSVHVLHRLQIQPSSRYWCMWILQGLFSSHSAEIEESLLNSGHRFIVTDSIACDALGLDTTDNSFPWNFPDRIRIRSLPGARRTAEQPDDHRINSDVSRPVINQTR